MFVFCAALAAAGCSEGDGLARRYALSGKVTYNGRPVKNGQINFVAEDAKAGHNATAEIKDGEYKSVTTLTPGDGILPGKYRVSISALEAVDLSKVMPPTGAADQVAVAQAQAKAKPLVPLKYGNAFDSGLQLDMKAGSMTQDFALKD